MRWRSFAAGDEVGSAPTAGAATEPSGGRLARRKPGSAAARPGGARSVHHGDRRMASRMQPGTISMQEPARAIRLAIGRCAQVGAARWRKRAAAAGDGGRFGQSSWSVALSGELFTPAAPAQRSCCLPTRCAG